MSADLMDLYVRARNLWGEASVDGRLWAQAYAADRAFTEALNATRP